MLVYVMLEPIFTTKENIIDLRTNTLTPENGFQVLCDGFIRYNSKDAVKQMENYDEMLKQNLAYRANVKDVILNGDVYAVVADFDGREKELTDKQIYGGTISKNYENATSEICTFIKLMKESAKKEALKGNNNVAENIISNINLFRLDTEVREGLYQMVKDYEEKSEVKLNDEDEYEVANGLKQLSAVAECAEKACKSLSRTYDKVKYQYQKEN